MQKRKQHEAVPLGAVATRPTRVILVVHEDDGWRLVVHEEAVAWAVTEETTCEALASLVEIGTLTKPEAFGLCVDLARACDPTDSTNAH